MNTEPTAPLPADRRCLDRRVRAGRQIGPLIQVLKQSLWNEEERIRRAEAEIFKIKQELLELGCELPLNE